MRLLDVYLVVNGVLLDPLVVRAPEVNGETRMPAKGDDLRVVIRPRGEPHHDQNYLATPSTPLDRP